VIFSIVHSVETIGDHHLVFTLKVNDLLSFAFKLSQTVVDTSFIEGQIVSNKIYKGEV
jgi:hypothetical protein